MVRAQLDFAIGPGFFFLLGEGQAGAHEALFVFEGFAGVFGAEEVEIRFAQGLGWVVESEAAEVALAAADEAALGVFEVNAVGEIVHQGFEEEAFVFELGVGEAKGGGHFRGDGDGAVAGAADGPDDASEEEADEGAADADGGGVGLGDASLEGGSGAEAEGPRMADKADGDGIGEMGMVVRMGGAPFGILAEDEVFGAGLEAFEDFEFKGGGYVFDNAAHELSGDEAGVDPADDGGLAVLDAIGGGAVAENGEEHDEAGAGVGAGFGEAHFAADHGGAGVAGAFGGDAAFRVGAEVLAEEVLGAGRGLEEFYEHEVGARAWVLDLELGLVIGASFSEEAVQVVFGDAGDEADAFEAGEAFFDGDGFEIGMPLVSFDGDAGGKEAFGAAEGVLVHEHAFGERGGDAAGDFVELVVSGHFDVHSADKPAAGGGGEGDGEDDPGGGVGDEGAVARSGGRGGWVGGRGGHRWRICGRNRQEESDLARSRSGRQAGSRTHSNTARLNCTVNAWRKSKIPEAGLHAQFGLSFGSAPPMKNG